MFKVPKLPLFPNHFTFFQNETKNKEHRKYGLVPGILTECVLRIKDLNFSESTPYFSTPHYHTQNDTSFSKRTEKGDGKNQ